MITTYTCNVPPQQEQGQPSDCLPKEMMFVSSVYEQYCQVTYTHSTDSHTALDNLLHELLMVRDSLLVLLEWFMHNNTDDVIHSVCIL